MKKLFLITLFFLGTILSSLHSSEDYCDGWRTGYKRGYCYDKQLCVAPIPPPCPVPEPGKNTYSDGYDRGFEKGREDAE